MVQLNPSRTFSTNGRIAASNTVSCDASGPKTYDNILPDNHRATSAPTLSKLYFLKLCARSSTQTSLLVQETTSWTLRTRSFAFSGLLCTTDGFGSRHLMAHRQRTTTWTCTLPPSLVALRCVVLLDIDNATQRTSQLTERYRNEKRDDENGDH